MRAAGQLVSNTVFMLCLASFTVPATFCQQNTRVSVEGHQVRYISGPTAYVEEVEGDRWVARSWSSYGRSNTDQAGYENAFEMRIKTDPQTEDPGRLLDSGWHWKAAADLPSTGRTPRHFAVELSSSILPIHITVHTLLDGTPVLRGR